MNFILRIDTLLTFYASRFAQYWVDFTGLSDSILLQILLGLAGIATLYRIIVLRQLGEGWLLIAIFVTHMSGRQTHAVGKERMVLEAVGVPPTLSWLAVFMFQLIVLEGVFALSVAISFFLRYVLFHVALSAPFWDALSSAVALLCWVFAYFMSRTPPKSPQKRLRFAALPTSV